MRIKRGLAGRNIIRIIFLSVNAFLLFFQRKKKVSWEADLKSRKLLKKV